MSAIDPDDNMEIKKDAVIFACGFSFGLMCFIFQPFVQFPPQSTQIVVESKPPVSDLVKIGQDEMIVPINMELTQGTKICLKKTWSSENKKDFLIWATDGSYFIAADWQFIDTEHGDEVTSNEWKFK